MNVKWEQACMLFTFILMIASLSKAQEQDFLPTIQRVEQTSIQQLSDSLGNRIPDFSYSGYEASNRPIPEAGIKIIVAQKDGDATSRIQSAIDYIASLQKDETKLKGAVLLEPGVYEISGTIYLRDSGIVLRGSGTGENGTVLLGTGVSRKPIIHILGKHDKAVIDSPQLSNDFIPLGAQTLQIQNNSLQTGEEIEIIKPIQQSWLDEIEMNEFGGETGWIGWKPRDWKFRWDREIIQKTGNQVELSAPLTMSLEPAEDEIKVIKYSWPGRIQHAGVENLSIHSTYNKENLKDEQHRWIGIAIENAKNCWVRQVNFKHLAGGAVHVLNSSKQVTVEDCISTEPISEIAAFRRHTFYTEGQQTLFQRCYSEFGYHDFAVGGFGTTGPNAFVQCESYLPYNFSGAIGSWATGVLFDVSNIDGAALGFFNRGQDGRGAGWTAANSALWESSASKILNFSPPTAQNWAFGVWGQFAGNGHWVDVNNHIWPRSLFYAQLSKRNSESIIDPQILELDSKPSTSPSQKQAQELTELARSTSTSLKEWIEKAGVRNPITIASNSTKKLQQKPEKQSLERENTNKKIEIINGKLSVNNKIITGKTQGVMWWRGSLRDHDVQNQGIHITRYAPGRWGKGLTDYLSETIENMSENHVTAIDHNYGLWYDRRMDDHERTRRIDADAWPPFYEQPFARSGEGIAWDHLSKYDLTKPNLWYWNRLKTFSDLAENEGKLLLHQNYFQHNIIEAGAHWSSSPWRPANNINNTGFPEPPPYAGEKRIFFSELFYDVDHPTRKKLHQQYIEQCLKNFQGNSNVIQFTSAEYTGPLHFMQFWVDVIQNWESKNENKALIGLAATKDVQDAILQDVKRNKTIDVIDIRYWHYSENGKVYAPEGGKHMAPRQHARQMRSGKETNESVYRAIREYSKKYPEKAIIYNTNGGSRFGWAQLMAGASLAPIPAVEAPLFEEETLKMNFYSENEQIWEMRNGKESFLFYLKNELDFEVELPQGNTTFKVHSIDANSGKSLREFTINSNDNIITPHNGENIFFIVNSQKL